MTKDIERSLDEVYDVKRDPVLKQTSKEQLLKRMYQEQSQFKWQPLFAIITLCAILCLFIVTLPSLNMDKGSIHTGTKLSELVDGQSSIEKIYIAETHSEHFFAANNPWFYIGVFDLDWRYTDSWVKSLENAIQEAKPVSQVTWNKESMDIRDIRIKYSLRNLNEELRLKAFFINDSNSNSVYMKDMDSGQMYEVQGKTAVNLNMYQFVKPLEGNLQMILYLGMASYMLTYFVGLIIRDKNPILKRTKRFINNRQKIITITVRLLVVLIALSNLYLLGVMNIVVAFVLVTMMFAYPLYTELRYRKEVKRHYLVISQYIVACLFVGVIFLIA
ncbi:hypothetical protein ACQKMD_10755 [Viridibacillus sp. NPDC096237]|uniref:hypothetical protein n=1 Tax=Viridibacillus sp. NPDC096237 TaxID=3390721 RepID=UPI003D05C6FC